MKDCCDKMELEEIEPFVVACKNCHAINEDAIEETMENQYYQPEHHSYVGYQHKHHVAEVIKRLQCAEPGRDKLDLQKIRQSLNGDYSLNNIYNKCDRKHMTYIFCQMNNIPLPDIPQHLISLINDTIRKISESGRKKCPNYIKIIERICLKKGYHNILPYLYIKGCNEKLDNFIDQYI